ncbi:NADH-quinone oxidoreductase subunit C [Chryseolinea sp. T2]|uniref:NADH-quinone oxidoreductase subunit C n=1 Tax=Chryseolinea sp. T2 TaxID=3129255 RepID=UPI0030788015
MQPFEEILALVKKQCTHSDAVADEAATPKAIRVHADDLLPVMQELLNHSSLYFDMLSCITGIDNGPGHDMEVAYNLYSIPFGHQLMIKVKLNRDNPAIESLNHFWRSANWLEREIFDMYGIVFLNHPDLRRILMPADWEGHPLRKDYKHQEYYRDIKVEY